MKRLMTAVQKLKSFPRHKAPFSGPVAASRDWQTLSCQKNLDIQTGPNRKLEYQTFRKRLLTFYLPISKTNDLVTFIGTELWWVFHYRTTCFSALNAPGPTWRRLSSATVICQVLRKALTLIRFTRHTRGLWSPWFIIHLWLWAARLSHDRGQGGTDSLVKAGVRVLLRVELGELMGERVQGAAVGAQGLRGGWMRWYGRQSDRGWSARGLQA